MAITCYSIIYVYVAKLHVHVNKVLLLQGWSIYLLYIETFSNVVQLDVASYLHAIYSGCGLLAGVIRIYPKQQIGNSKSKYIRIRIFIPACMCHVAIHVVLIL